MISGFKIFVGMYVVMIVLLLEVINISGNIFFIIFKLILFECKNFNVFVNVLKEFVNLFVFKVIDGGKLIVSNVGVEISLFLLIIELMNEVIKLKVIIINIIDKF